MLFVPVHDGKMFTWEGKTGSAEASDFGRRPVASRVWPDSADFGFKVVGKNGFQKLFTAAREDRRDGELRSTTFTSQDGIEIVIFND
jgi:hypothetical protein